MRISRKHLVILALFCAMGSIARAENVKAVLFPFREAEISSRVESTLTRCCFRVGEPFQQDATLLELDEALFAIQLRRMEEQERFTRAVLADKKELRAGKFTSDFEVKKAEYEWQSVKIQQDEARLKLAYCKIKAPFPGKIVEVLKQEHETVKPGEPLLKIIDDSFLFAVLNIPLKQLKPVGSELSLKLENGMTVQGRIYEVSPQANHRTGTLRVRVLIPNARGALRAGMTGEVADAQ